MFLPQKGFSKEAASSLQDCPNVLLCILDCANRSQGCTIVQISGWSECAGHGKGRDSCVYVGGLSSPISTFSLPFTVSTIVQNVTRVKNVHKMKFVPFATIQKVRILFYVCSCFVITLDYRGSQNYSGSKPYRELLQRYTRR